MSPNRGTPPVRIYQPVDPEIADLVPRYVSQCRSFLVRLGHHFHDDEFEAIAAIGWDLHGSGRAFGLERISALGDRIARAAEQADGPTVLRGVHALQRYLDALTLVFPDSATGSPRTDRDAGPSSSANAGR